METQGEYPGTVWYRPSIPGILALPRHRVYGGATGGIFRDCLVPSEYPIPYSGIPRHMEGDPGTVWYCPGIPGVCSTKAEGDPGTVWYCPGIPGVCYGGPVGHAM